MVDQHSLNGLQPWSLLGQQKLASRKLGWLLRRPVKTRQVSALAANLRAGGVAKVLRALHKEATGIDPSVENSTAVGAIGNPGNVVE